VGDPVSAQLRLNGADVLKEMSWSEEIDQYIQRPALKLLMRLHQEQLGMELRPYCLNVWLKSR
jgi:hypothetical protein